MTFFLLLTVLVIAVIGVVLLMVSTRHTSRLNIAKYQTKWLEIENSLQKDNPATYQVVVFAADKLVDAALKERGFRGTTMGERMKAAAKVWKNANHVWSAHKLRNQLAHESDAQVSYDTAQRALVAFKQALKDLGAI